MLGPEGALPPRGARAPRDISGQKKPLHRERFAVVSGFDDADA